MAENTRAQAKIDEQLKNHQQQLNELRLAQTQQHDELVAMIKQLQPNQPPSSSVRTNTDDLSSQAADDGIIPFQPHYNKFIRMDVPHFDGTDPTGWTFKVEQFFHYYSIPEDQRLALTSFHLDGPALSWFQWAKANNLLHSWKGFLDSIQLRFGPSLYEDPKGELSKLHQQSSVADYQSRFETASNKVSGLSEAFLISFFISGLKPDLKRELQIAQPTSLLQTFSLARMFEQKYEELKRGWKPVWSPPMNGPGLLPTPPHPPAKAIAAPPLRQFPIRTRQLSKEEMKIKRDKGLCYFCDEKYVPGHDCRRRLYHLSAIDDDSEGILAEDIPIERPEIPDALQEDNSGEMSFYALVGHQNPNSIRVTGVSAQHSLHVLIDSGSTHNFVREKIAHTLNWPILPTPPFKVRIGNGESLICTKKCVDVNLSLQHTEFSIDIFLLPIKGADVVLGIQWLAELGSIVTNYKLSTMEFQWKGQPIKLVGEAELNPSPFTASHFKSLTKTNSIASCFTLICLNENPTSPPSLQSQPMEKQVSLPAPISDLLHQFDDVFESPTELPPHREWDHQIHLFPGSKPVNVKPYRYPHFLKNEIEKLVQEMLNSGLIVPSHSPYSSPVLLEKKKITHGASV
ncbi:uncharacterized protein LOC143875969 [Tasmannia lanceolata]|uniref:uncharacterized protein LOC143875969 n=1 Tax=Tasmannia lanceolata TaxID=3420 RepID=UPI00406407C9